MSRGFRAGDRRDDRVPLEVFLTEYVDEQPHRGVTSNISPTGLYVNRVRQPRWFARDHRFVQLELPLPGTSDTIWARGQIRRDELEFPELVHGTGIEIVDIARGHARMLRDWVIEQQRQRLTQVLELVRRNRYH
ncbi:MAG TPA: PilZ domain-containing protein [Polyangia bacterium]|nr:PilZ domain-containing protein [Polyangia bacterium]